MPVESTTKCPTSPGTYGGTSVTDDLTINLNESAATDTVQLVVSLAYDGFTYGGQGSVVADLAFSANRELLHKFTYPAVAGAEVVHTFKACVPKSLGTIKISNVLNVSPECVIDVPADPSVLFAVAFL